MAFNVSESHPPGPKVSVVDKSSRNDERARSIASGELLNGPAGRKELADQIPTKQQVT
ncbi:hypothetical protein MesoLjLc_32930 [Mesorhizobium sp. L-8-10]|uniref:hypothetical protein n=1 Tax=unclassified Mesorhizobium TaxID=325217 RepID=UPI001925E455|nr:MULTISPECIES: hypothetical protein [unclassified Mesorhizobium]BCH23633.1 hypothetical protein MesoLjLb_34180 [Mesorhizobium sp. L-8-3]BCH31363.1 hypothetical protein MesoLjLc_32930 [Mesorhizobium sp. L-8-10]